MTPKSSPQICKAMTAFAVGFSLLWGAAVHAQTSSLPSYVIDEFGSPPGVPDGPLSTSLQASVQAAFVTSMSEGTWGSAQIDALAEISASGDPRLAWLISDLMRFVSDRRLNAELSGAASVLLGREFGSGNTWGAVTDHLIAWDIPAPPNYLQTKRAIFARRGFNSPVQLNRRYLV